MVHCLYEPIYLVSGRNDDPIERVSDWVLGRLRRLVNGADDKRGKLRWEGSLMFNSKARMNPFTSLFVFVLRCTRSLVDDIDNWRGEV